MPHFSSVLRFVLTFIPPRRSLPFVALLALASGCSGGQGSPGDTATKTVLYPKVDDRGIVIYSTKEPYTPPVKDDRPIVLTREQQPEELNRVRQENIRSEN